MMIIPQLDKGKPKKDNEEKPQIPKTASDLQRLKLEKLMKNPDKPVLIPERPREKGTPHVPDFVRNVMGSSAGAGSGEFHVYRHLRRKEYARQKYIQIKGEKELLEDKYHERIEENKRIAEEKTAKKRAKRLKKKEKLKNKPKKRKCETLSKEKSSEDSESENESEIDNTNLLKKESDSENKKSTEMENQESQSNEIVSNKSSPSQEDNTSIQDTVPSSDIKKEENDKESSSSSSE